MRSLPVAPATVKKPLPVAPYKPTAPASTESCFVNISGPIELSPVHPTIKPFTYSSGHERVSSFGELKYYLSETDADNGVNRLTDVDYLDYEISPSTPITDGRTHSATIKFTLRGRIRYNNLYVVLALVG